MTIENLARRYSDATDVETVLKRLTVTADRCPHVLLRALDLFALRGLLPHQVNFVCGEDEARFTILTDAPAVQAERLLAKLRMIVSVRSAEMSEEPG